jgi:hypothetical protein
MKVSASHELFYVGFSHPRCGSGFTSSLIAANGLQVGHERIRQSGIISWMLIAERELNPWGDALGSLNPYNHKFLVARSPLTALVSVMGENLNVRSFAWRVQVIWDVLGIDLLAPDVIPQTSLAWAVGSFSLWYEMALTFDPAFIFRVDRPEDDKVLSEGLGIPIQRNKAISSNSRPERHAGLHFEAQMLSSLPRAWTVRFAKVAQLVGYPEDAAAILKNARQYMPPHRRSVDGIPEITEEHLE